MSEYASQRKYQKKWYHERKKNGLCIKCGKPAMEGHLAVISVGHDAASASYIKGKLCGDVGYCNSPRLTPVPGGVGLLTRAMLMQHVDKTGRTGQ